MDTWSWAATSLCGLLAGEKTFVPRECAQPFATAASGRIWYNMRMKLRINREFLVRHLFALAVFASLCCWFGYDALVRYPSTSAHDLYVSIERSEPPEDMGQAALEAFKEQKTSTQRIFTALTALAAAAVGLHLLAVAGFRFSFDDDGFVLSGRRFAWKDIEGVDDSAWEKKRIVRISGAGWKATLDAWHHDGVKEFFAKMAERRSAAV